MAWSQPGSWELLTLRGGRGRRALGYALGVLATVVTVLSFLPFRDDTTPLTKAFAFLVAVVLAAWAGGLGPGILASVASFLAFNYFFLPPYDTFTVHRPEYVAVLFVFLGLSLVISALLATARERAEAAEARRRELQMLLDLSRYLVEGGPGGDAYRAMLGRLARQFGFASVSLSVMESERYRGLRDMFTVDDAGRPVSGDSVAAERSCEDFALIVGGRALGVVHLRGDRGPLSEAERRILRGFCDQLALLLEYDRLLSAAVEKELGHRRGSSTA